MKQSISKRDARARELVGRVLVSSRSKYSISMKQSIGKHDARARVLVGRVLVSSRVGIVLV